MFSFLSFRPFSQPAAYITQHAASPLSNIYKGYLSDYFQVPPFNFYILFGCFYFILFHTFAPLQHRTEILYSLFCYINLTNLVTVNFAH